MGGSAEAEEILLVSALSVALPTRTGELRLGASRTLAEAKQYRELRPIDLCIT
jgi:hypothetical protein